MKSVEEVEKLLWCPPFPTSLQYIWDAYQDLRKRACPGEHGPDPISWLDIVAYNTLMRRQFTPWESALLARLDDAYLSARVAQINADAEARANANAQEQEQSGVRRIVSRNRG